MRESGSARRGERGPDAGGVDDAAIEARGLTRRFGRHHALADVSLTVPRGTRFALLGANGAGKTTFIRCVTGFLLPSDGEVRVEGLSPTRDPRGVKERIGFVMETSRLYPELRVSGFLRFMGGARGLSGPALDAAVERVLARFDLESVARRMVGNLSKGYQQRVSLAQAFLHDPPIVIVDEPTGGLDPVQRGEVQDTLAELEGRRTLLLCTHDLAEARKLASRVAVLNAGRLVAEGPTGEILDRDDPLSLFRGGEAA
jgi:ABC-2 type transport system ATP-binding protein